MIIIKLILAHLLGDFIFQPTSWVHDKEAKKGRSFYLYIHVLIHFILSMLFLWDWHFWWVATIVAGSHFVIDLLKLNFQKVENKRLWFFADQLLHLMVIAGLYIFINNLWGTLALSPQSWMLITGALFLTVPASVIVKILITSWTPITPEKDSVQSDSLANAGKYIGILERLLVFTFIVVNHWEGVGFMIAAKSVFRFSDLDEAKQRKLTEYVMIGTLLSFGMAVLVGILVRI